MQLIRYAAGLTFLMAALATPTSAKAQCRGIVVGGPRVRVVAPCLRRGRRVLLRRGVVVRRAPVVVRVMPVPPPVVVRVFPAPPSTPAPPPPPPPVNVQPVAPCPTPPPAPMVHRRHRLPSLFTLGMFVEGTMFKDGGLGGGALYAQLRLSRALHLYASVGANASCTNCNKDDPNRTDLKTTFGLQYYFLANHAFSPYLRGTMVYQAVDFTDRNDENRSIYKAHQFGAEFAAGLEWKVARWFILGADVAYIGLKRLDGADAGIDGPMPQGMGKGVPTVNNFDHGATFRFNVAFRF